jgi:hypothetical protein
LDLYKALPIDKITLHKSMPKVSDYLDERFNPNKLTMAALQSIFILHNVRWTWGMKKPALVEVFNKQIKPKAAELREAQDMNRKCLPSKDRIIDGVTGLPLNDIVIGIDKQPGKRSIVCGAVNSFQD